MKILNILLTVIFLLNIFVLPFNVFAADDQSASSSAEPVDVYAVFWPIVPGKTVADSMFWFKQMKEGFGGFFSFGDINKSGYEISLSEKRMVEANKLLDDKDYPNANKSLDMNKQHRDAAIKLMKKAQEDKRKVDDLKGKLVTSLQNQQKVMQYRLTSLPDDQKPKIEEIIKDLTLQISEAR